jgi:adenylate kinase family enzyme
MRANAESLSRGELRMDDYYSQLSDEEKQKVDAKVRVIFHQTPKDGSLSHELKRIKRQSLAQKMLHIAQEASEANNTREPKE